MVPMHAQNAYSSLTTNNISDSKKQTMREKEKASRHS